PLSGGPSSAVRDLLACPSVELFVDRAQAARPEFTITEENLRSVAALCAELEGIPLALELAAARVQVLTPAQMLGQLDSRFGLLVGQHQDQPPRHHTLYSALQWSYRLLPPDLQPFFARLSVFRDGWSLDAAQAVCVGVGEYGCVGDGERGRNEAQSHTSPGS